MINQNDIKDILDLLNSAIKKQDWEYVIEAIEYIQEFQEDPQYEED